LLVGTATFPNNQVGYNDFVFDNLSSAVKSELATRLNSGGSSPIRLAITPAAGSQVAADWEGNFIFNQPILTVLAEEAGSLPAWLAAGSVATWDAGSHHLNVTGTATIIADPGSDAPIVVANGPGAQISVAPTSGDHFIHIGGLTLSAGATFTVDSLGGARTSSNHEALVIGSNSGPAPTVSIDAASKLDLTDNDLIVHQGSLATMAALAALGRNVAPGGFADGSWNGNGLTSSAAASAFNNNGYEQTALAVVLNSALPFGSYNNWQLGAQDEALASSDILVKYTYNGDFSLDGAVDDIAAALIGAFYDGGATTGHSWADGDTNGDGLVDDSDVALFGAVYGNGSLNGPLL
jgi:hypothetical protein